MSEPIDALYATHGELTKAMFLRGLSAAERRRLTRVRRAIDRAQSSDVWRYWRTWHVRRGRAQRLAWRKWKRLALFGLRWNHERTAAPGASIR